MKNSLYALLKIEQLLPLTLILVTLVFGIVLICSSFGGQRSSRREYLSGQLSAAVNTFPDTTYNIHLGQGGYATWLPIKLDNGRLDNVDAVWNDSTYPNSSTPSNTYNMYYAKFDRDNTWDPNGTQFNWFKTNHPDWIVYQCDGSTPAWELNDHAQVPLDITNPAVLSFMLTSYYEPAIKNGFKAISFDNVNLTNDFNRCGVWKSGKFVYLYGGTSSTDLHGTNYSNTVFAWAKTMYGDIKSYSPGTMVTMNFPLDFVNSLQTIESMSAYYDLVYDERGFTNFGTGTTPYLTGSQWVEEEQYMLYLASHAKSVFFVCHVPDSTPTRQEIQWCLSNYLLTKNTYSYSASYELICPAGNCNADYITNEDFAQIGKQSSDVHTYEYNDVYTRWYSNGQVLVNTSATNTYTITLTTNTYQDLYGNAVNSVVLAPHSGEVLLTISRPAPPPTPPATTPPSSGASSTPSSSGGHSSSTPSTQGQVQLVNSTTGQPLANATIMYGNGQTATTDGNGDAAIPQNAGSVNEVTVGGKNIKINMQIGDNGKYRLLVNPLTGKLASVIYAAHSPSELWIVVLAIIVLLSSSVSGVVLYMRRRLRRKNDVLPPEPMGTVITG